MGPVLCIFGFAYQSSLDAVCSRGKQRSFQLCLHLSVEKGKSLEEEWEQLNYFMLRHNKTNFKNYCLMLIIYSQYLVPVELMRLLST